jgi:hypothetical protein
MSGKKVGRVGRPTPATFSWAATPTSRRAPGRCRPGLKKGLIAALTGRDPNGWRLDGNGSTLDPAAKCGHAEGGLAHWHTQKGTRGTL